MSRITSDPLGRSSALIIGDEILGLVIDGDVGAELAADLAFFRGAGGGEDAARPMPWPAWMATVPMPDLPPWTRKVSPAFSPPRSNTLCQTVKNVSGSAAASTIDSPCGTGRAWVSAPRSIPHSRRRRPAP